MRGVNFKVRMIIAILFMVFSAIVGYLFVRSVLDTFAGFVYVIVVLLGAALIYLTCFNVLLKIVSPGKNNPNRATSESKEYIFGISFVLSITGVGMLDYHYSNSHVEITDKVIEKQILTGIKGSLYCHEVELESGISQCVDTQCWHGVEKEITITIKPRFGLFGLKKLDLPCSAI